MKNIIFLTDFSANADTALDYLADFVCDVEECNVYLIHTFQVATRTGMLLSVKERIREDAKALLSIRKQRFEKVTEYKHFVFSKAIHGSLKDVVEKLEKQLEAQLIVTSMRGESIADDNLIGAKAGSLIIQTKVPLLLIPPGHQYQSLSKITFALKQPKIKAAKTVSILNDLFNANDPKLKVLTVDKTDEESNLHLDNYQYDLDHSDKDSIYDAIMDEEGKDASDLIAVIRRKRGFFERFLASGAFKKELLDINVPLLILRGAQ